MSLSQIMIFCVALAVMAGTPGPGIAALVSRILTNGFWDVLPFLAAMWVGEAIWLTVAMLGLSALAHSFAFMFLVLKYAGAAYLLFLAWKMWRAPVNIEDAALPRRRPLRMFGAGLMVTLGNPKIMVFYLAVLPAIIDIRHVTLGRWAILTAALFCVLPATDLTWSFVATRARRLLRSPKAMRVANRTSAGVMAGAAAVIAAK
ncbi:MAG: LysE family translocator [Rhodospirillales bacterium]|nr:LysE family translocator [Rhodospirillales bacterium]